MNATKPDSGNDPGLPTATVGDVLKELQIKNARTGAIVFCAHAICDADELELRPLIVDLLEVASFQLKAMDTALEVILSSVAIAVEGGAQ